MSGDLLDDSAMTHVDSDDIRRTIATSVKQLRSKFRLIPIQLQRYNENLAKELRSKWDEENKLFRQQKVRETPTQRLQRWKDMAKRYRLYALMELTNRFYIELRQMRSELALIVAMYQFSEVETILADQVNWKQSTLDDLDSLVMRIKGPRKPSKKKFGMKDIEYNVGTAYLEMIQPLLDWAAETKEKIDKLTAPRSKMKYETKYKRFKEAVVAREYLTILCQSIAPRKEGIKLMQTINDLDDPDEFWMQVFDDS